MKLTFSEWLALEIEKPPTNPDYDPEGNSSRAIMTRVVDKGWLSHIWWAMRVYAGIWQDIKSNWNGWYTTIGYVVSMIVLPLLLPVAPFVLGWVSYKRAMRDYQEAYQEYLENQE